jgi:hypothetical protein
MRKTYAIFTITKKQHLVAGVLLLTCLLLSLSVLARLASASPLQAHPASLTEHSAGPADPPGPQFPPNKQSNCSFPGDRGPQFNEGGAEFAYVFNTVPQTVAPNSAVLFNNTSILQGFFYNPKTGDLITFRAGAFRVTYSVTNQATNLFALARNGVPIPGTVYLSNSNPGANNGSQNNGQAIIRLSPCDKLTLQNRSTGPVQLATLFTTPGTPATVNASLLVDEIK